MAVNAYYRTALTGGGATALDSITIENLNDGDFALCSVSGDFYVYKMDITSGVDENSPYVIEPDDVATTDERWIQQSVPWKGDSGSMFLNSSWVKDPQEMLWNVAEEDNAGIGYWLNSSGDALVTPRLFEDEECWDNLALVGSVASVATGGVYVDILDQTTGSGGVLTNLILPAVETGNSVSVRVTVDGTLYDALTFTSENDTDRFFAGKATGWAAHGGRGNADMVWPDNMSSETGLVSGLAFRHTRSGTNDAWTFLCTPNACLCSTPCVRFESTLKVEMMSSTVTLSTEQRKGAAIYTLDQH